MSEKIRVAIIGSTGRGDYGHTLDVAWKEVPEAQIVAVADDNEKGRAAAAERAGVKAAYADYRAMLDKEKPQVVSICQRWIDRHHEMALTCLERGIHVFMEKPLCRNLTEADQLVRACEMTHAKLALAHQTRYCPIIPVVKQLLADGKLGTLLEMRGRGKEDQRGGPEDLWVLGSHLLNMMQIFAGDPQACFASITSKDKPITKSDVVEGNEGLGPLAGDAVEARFQFPKGVTGYFSSHRGQEGKPSRFGLQIFGSKGVVEYLTGYVPDVWFLPDPGWSPGRSKATWQKVTSAGIGKPETIKPVGVPAGNVAAIKDLLAAITENRQPLCGIYDARWTVEMIMGVFESQRLGKPTSLPLQNRQHPLTML
jgi:predicted dehydrogenase